MEEPGEEWQAKLKITAVKSIKAMQRVHGKWARNEQQYTHNLARLHGNGKKLD